MVQISTGVLTWFGFRFENKLDLIESKRDVRSK